MNPLFHVVYHIYINICSFLSFKRVTWNILLLWYDITLDEIYLEIEQIVWCWVFFVFHMPFGDSKKSEISFRSKGYEKTGNFSFTFFWFMRVWCTSMFRSIVLFGICYNYFLDIIAWLNLWLHRNFLFPKIVLNAFEQLKGAFCFPFLVNFLFCLQYFQGVMHRPKFQTSF